MRKFKFDDGGKRKHFPTKMKKDRSADCSTRAIALATKKDYLEVMKDQFALGLEMGRMPNEDAVTEKLLEQYGFEKQKTLKDKYGRKYRVKEFPKSNVILRVSKHLVYVSNAYILDTWNSGNKAVGVWYKKVK